MKENTICGSNAVDEALHAGRRVNRIYIAKESSPKKLQRIIDRARALKVPFDFVPQAKLNEMSGSREHQGIVAKVSPLDYMELDEWLTQCPPRATLLVLDQIQHQGNLGMLIRTAVGAGAQGILMGSRGGALLDDTVVRASAGTVFKIPVIHCPNIAQAVRRLKDENFWVYGLDAQADQTVFQLEWPERSAIVLGNETSGLRPGVRKICDELLSIPLANGLDSLNVAVAASVTLFQIVAQRQ